MTRIALIALALALAGELSTIFWIPKLEQPIQYDHGRICIPAMMPAPCAPRKDAK